MVKFTHLSDDKAKSPCMVDVSHKKETLRIAIAEAFVELSPRILDAIKENSVAKGNVFVVSEIAGIMGAKKTFELIPLCHILNIDSVLVKCFLKENGVLIRTKVTATQKTGVEMEAMTGCCISALTVYDMCKGIDKGIKIAYVKLLYKSGGKSGEYNPYGIDPYRWDVV